MAQCAGRRNKTKSLATKQVLSADSFCVNAINAHNESNDGGHISGGWMPAAGSGKKCMRTYSGCRSQHMPLRGSIMALTAPLVVQVIRGHKETDSRFVLCLWFVHDMFMVCLWFVHGLFYGG